MSHYQGCGKGNIRDFGECDFLVRPNSWQEFERIAEDLVVNNSGLSISSSETKNSRTRSQTRPHSQPILNMGTLSGGCFSQSQMDRLQILQNKAGNYKR